MRARSSGSYGQMMGPKMAMKIIVPTITLPTMAMRCFLKRIHASCHWLSGSRETSKSSSLAAARTSWAAVLWRMSSPGPWNSPACS